MSFQWRQYHLHCEIRLTDRLHAWIKLFHGIQYMSITKWLTILVSLAMKRSAGLVYYLFLCIVSTFFAFDLGHQALASNPCDIQPS